MPNHTILHIEDFIEMLERGDDFSFIAQVAHVKPESVERRFERLPKEVRDRIRHEREIRGMGCKA
jgi:hypothetical protein